MKTEHTVRFVGPAWIIFIITILAGGSFDGWGVALLLLLATISYSYVTEETS